MVVQKVEYFYLGVTSQVFDQSFQSHVSGRYFPESNALQRVDFGQRQGFENLFNGQGVALFPEVKSDQRSVFFKIELDYVHEMLVNLNLVLPGQFRVLFAQYHQGRFIL